jgi:enterochelin esterase-like enzyme
MAVVTVTISACGPGKQAAGGSPTVPLPGQLAAGSVSTVTISATVSAFARDAKVYLPPGYGKTPQAPPVLDLLSGVPGDVSDWFDQIRIERMFDDFAAKHTERALVVVTPDDTEVDEDLLCTDSPLGNAGWHRALLPTFLDFSGEKQPMRDDRETAVDEVFCGDSSAYDKHDPLTILATRTFPEPAGELAVRDDDEPYTGEQPVVLEACRRAGMQIDASVLSGGHDWDLWTTAFRPSLPRLAQRMQLETVR